MPEPCTPLPAGVAGRSGTVGLPASGGGFGGGTAPLKGLVGGGGGGAPALDVGGGGTGGAAGVGGGGVIPDGSVLGGRVMRIVSFLESSSWAFVGVSSAINDAWRTGFYLSQGYECQPVYWGEKRGKHMADAQGDDFGALK